MSVTDKLHRNIGWAIVLAECTHVFCCVLPTVVTVIGVLSSVSTVIQVPVFLLDIHEFLHAYEIPVIAFSGAMLGLGWILYVVARRIECARPHCEPHDTVCAPAKRNTHWVLIAASVLFLVNIVVYGSLHQESADLLHEQAVHAHEHQEHGHPAH
jgi:hypothetical protein